MSSLQKTSGSAKKKCTKMIQSRNDHPSHHYHQKVDLTWPHQTHSPTLSNSKIVQDPPNSIMILPRDGSFSLWAQLFYLSSPKVFFTAVIRSTKPPLQASCPTFLPPSSSYPSEVFPLPYAHAGPFKNAMRHTTPCLWMFPATAVNLKTFKMLSLSAYTLPKTQKGEPVLRSSQSPSMIYSDFKNSSPHKHRHTPLGSNPTVGRHAFSSLSGSVRPPFKLPWIRSQLTKRLNLWPKRCDTGANWSFSLTTAQRSQI